MSYFSNFPNIYYDFNIAGDNQVKIIRDISMNVRFKHELLNSVTLFDEYDIRDGETPDIISERVYGTPEYNWIIMLFNDRFNYSEDFPLSTFQLEQKVIDDYGANNRDAVHHYVNQAGYIMTSVDRYVDPHTTQKKVWCSLNFESNVVVATEADGFSLINDGVSLLEVTGLGLPSSIVKVVEFVDDTTLIIDTPATQLLNSELTFTYIIDPMLTVTPVTNYDYELELNERKRRIRLMHPSQLAPLLVQMETLYG